MDSKDINLRELSDEGYIRFSIKAKDTTENEHVHSAFRAFCADNAKNDYTFGLQLLLQNLDYVHSINSLWSRIESLEEKVAELKAVPKKKKETPTTGCF